MTNSTKSVFSLILSIFITINSQSQITFDKWFEGKTMRFDYFHSGNSLQEHFAADRALNDGAWSGSQTQLIDKLRYGLYFFEISDPKTNTVLYSRGFASIFGEWQTTPEAEQEWGTFHESMRFPWPKQIVNLTLYKRDSRNEFQPIWNYAVNPESITAIPQPLVNGLKTWNYMNNGPSTEKVDIVVLGDGYTQDQMPKFAADVKRLTEELFNVEPFKSRRNEFNVWVVETPCTTPGVNKPHPQEFNRTPLSLSYGAFDSERYLLGFDNRAIRDAASAVPYEFMCIIVNERTYGGGGIYNLYATTSADNKFGDYIFVHEFGHHFAALADEYYTSATSYEAPSIELEPWEANITALKDPKTLKWKHLTDPSTPIPTPWNKEDFDAFSYEIQRERTKIRAEKKPESVMEELFERERTHEREMIKKMEFTGKVGAFEGAGYQPKGLYRTETDCIMFTRNRQAFCKVCQAAIAEVIDQYTK